MSKRDISTQDKLAYYLLKSMNKAIRDYEMIADGDRIAVAVSGGKDSLALLHLLRLRQQSAAEKYETVAVHVVMGQADGTACTEAAGRSTLGAYLQATGQEYAFEPVEVAEQPDCFRCSHLRRQALFRAARRLGCNKLALGHHADDAAETTLLNLIFHGRVETLAPRRSFFDGQFVLIRPLIYVPEKRLARLAQACALPVMAASCPQRITSRRQWVKELIQSLEQEYPKVKINLFRAGLRPAMASTDPSRKESNERDDDSVHLLSPAR
jgi:tRNA 2-thiocytidine biosynthesis protein TtcA